MRANRYYRLAWALALLAGCRAAPGPKFRPGPPGGGYAGGRVDAYPVPDRAAEPVGAPLPADSAAAPPLKAALPNVPVTAPATALPASPAPTGQPEAVPVRTPLPPPLPIPPTQPVRPRSPLLLAGAVGAAAVAYTATSLLALPYILVVGGSLTVLLLVGGAVVLGARKLGRLFRRRRDPASPAQ